MGQVAGFAHVSYNLQTPFTWLAGVKTDIPLIPDTISTQAVDINNQGQILLKGVTSTGGSRRGSVWYDNAQHLLSDLPGGSTDTSPAAMNELNPTQVAGTASSNLGTEGALWEDGGVTGLGRLPFSGSVSSYVLDINDSGTIVGYGYSGDAYVRTAEGIVTLLAAPAGYKNCQALAINNQGLVVGICQALAVYQLQALLWDINYPTLPQLLPVPAGATNTRAADINDDGLVTGAASSTPYSTEKAVQWDTRTNPITVTDLNTVLDFSGLNRTIQAVRPINKNGLMVGLGTDPSLLNLQTYLLTPYVTTAHLAANPTALTFSATGDIDPASQSLSISNALGAGAMNWTINSSAPWLTVTPAIGSGNASVSVSVSVPGLVPGLYVGNLTIASDQADNSPLTVQVSLTVENGAPPHILVNPASFSFSFQYGSGNPTPQTLLLSNIGGGVLSWSLSSNQAWLTATPASGTDYGIVTVSVNAALLSTGTFSGMITIADPSADNAPLAVPVTVTVVPRPNIGYSPASFSFSALEGGANPAPQTLAISNTGGGTLNWTLSDSQPWLSVAPFTGLNSGTATVSVNIAGLAAGSYPAYISIVDPMAGNSPRTVSVTLTILKKPRIAFSPASFSFSTVEGGANPATQALTISNSGGGTLYWTLTESIPWLSAAPLSGTNAGSSTLTVDISGLAAGTYSGTINIIDPNADNSPSPVGITLTILPKPSRIAFSPASFTFTAPQGGPNPATQTLSISNSGGGTLNWALSVNQAWLSVAPATGANAGTSTLSVNTYGLAVGTYTAAITITDPAAGNSPQTVPVTLSITAGGPYVRTDMAGVDLNVFTGQPTKSAAWFQVWNAGTGTLNWTVTTSGSWLTVKPSRGSSTGPASSTLVTINMSWGGVGVYTGSVTVKNGAKPTDVWVIPVRVTVKDPLKVTAPNGGEYLKYNSTFNVTWQTDPLIAPLANRAVIYCTTNGGTSWISAASLPGNPGSYPWQVPTLKTASSKCKIKVVLTDQAGSSLGQDISDAVFTIGK